ncbi:hypothetical protein BDV96DRAFT_296111 [Lophiotrema nucula]|uniref:Uncharacterized protein n=1 Tax=Lophiotrema nucula TaxID=690887 RepID=A0A6A5YN07_9PLEO|nr:hypothetical protein BDV96DRAFT_296111 [Lophiotrema nucula]
MLKQGPQLRRGLWWMENQPWSPLAATPQRQRCALALASASVHCQTRPTNKNTAEAAGVCDPLLARPLPPPPSTEADVDREWRRAGRCGQRPLCADQAGGGIPRFGVRSRQACSLITRRHRPSSQSRRQAHRLESEHRARPVHNAGDGSRYGGPVQAEVNATCSACRRCRFGQM